MRLRSFFLCAALVFTVEAQAPAPSIPARLHDGTYTYVVKSDGRTVLTSDIVIRSDAANVTVSEKAQSPNLSVNTETTLTAATLRETSYRGSSPQQGAFSAAITPTRLTLTSRSASQSIDALPGTRGIVVSDGLASSLAILPMLVNSVLGAPLTNVALNAFVAAPVVFKPTAAPRPDGVPTTDIGSDLFISDTTFTFWYDPRTFVTHAVEGGGLDVRLTAQSTAVPPPTSFATP